ncbi:Inositol phosphorylceramide glucuronosyltransferase 1 [Camellia lanceoleosa]|uniref:Inositol phosphorylceramide glucuronosyltransferase 1 n=1 Tax=Camellia lanceoleosa TaxID=1840588 RepID=A0ACC0HCF1_9ERIC|nr:Inositol phosphorylceramide glucuronosyltransferase 1 [Camellia lanceoleosa]
MEEAKADIVGLWALRFLIGQFIRIRKISKSFDLAVLLPVISSYLPQKVLDSRSVPEMERLSTLYNADVGLYMFANKWMVDEKELRVIHYTLGPLKPWDWWTSWLLKPVDEHLEETLPNGGGKNPKDEILVKLLFLLPLFTLLFCYYRSFLQIHSFCDHVRQLYYKFRSRGILAYSAVSSSIVNSDEQFPNGLQSKVPMFLGGLSVFVCFVAAFISLALVLLIVPRQVMPWTGMLLMYEWTFMIFFLLFGSYLHLIYQWGKMKAYQVGSVSSRLESVGYDSGKGWLSLHMTKFSVHGIFLRHCYMLLWVRNGILVKLPFITLFSGDHCPVLEVRLDVCVISQLEDSHFYLEDLTGTVEINI